MQDVTGCQTEEKIQNASASRIPGGLFFTFLYLAHKATGKSRKNNFQSNTKTLVIYIDFLKIFKMFFLLL